jgi:hypothetical protein
VFARLQEMKELSLKKKAEAARAKADGKPFIDDLYSDFLNAGVISEEEELEERNKVSESGDLRLEKGKGIGTPLGEESRGRRGRTTRVVGFNVGGSSAYNPHLE